MSCARRNSRCLALSRLIRSAALHAHSTPSFSLAAPAMTMSTSANVMTALAPVRRASSDQGRQRSSESAASAGEPQARGEPRVVVGDIWRLDRHQVDVDRKVQQRLDVISRAEPQLLAHQQAPGCARPSRPSLDQPPPRVAVTTA